MEATSPGPRLKLAVPQPKKSHSSTSTPVPTVRSTKKSSSLESRHGLPPTHQLLDHHPLPKLCKDHHLLRISLNTSGPNATPMEETSPGLRLQLAVPQIPKSHSSTSSPELMVRSTKLSFSPEPRHGLPPTHQLLDH